MPEILCLTGNMKAQPKMHFLIMINVPLTHDVCALSLLPRRNSNVHDCVGSKSVSVLRIFLTLDN